MGAGVVNRHCPHMGCALDFRGERDVMEKRRYIAVIGGGPCGLMVAEMLAAGGHDVTVFDRMASPGRKLLIAGRGGLNLTHSEELEEFLLRYGDGAEWLGPAVRDFPPEALRAWCEGLGQETFIGSSGRVFPRSMKAVKLLRAWLQRLEKLGVRYAGRHSWQGWEGDALCFANGAGERVLVQADATLLALGGASWPRLGSDGHWVSILEAAGVGVAALRPANCGFVVPWSAHFSERFAGQALKPVAVSFEGVRRQGEAMITQRGIEGGLVYALSSRLREAVAARGEVVIELDLRPDMPCDVLAGKLQMRGSQSLSTVLRRCGFSPLASGLLREAGALPESPALLAARLKALPIRISGTEGIARAISSAGGVVCAAVDDDFMLRAREGVFVAGEMLDWEAPTGGYLLQGCFSTGVAAARGMMRYLNAR